MQKTNKYPNNRFTKTNVRRSKKITPHTRKEVTDKANRNGFVLETIPANNLLINSTYKERAESKNFFKEIYAKGGYYRYLLTPFIVLLVTIFIDFVLQFLTTTDSGSIIMTQNSLFFLVFSILVFCINIASIIFMGLATAKHNIQFGVAWYKVFRIIAIVFIFESLLTIIAYLTFLSPYIQTMFVSDSVKFIYLIYLIAWNLIKAVVYMIMMSLSYLLFFKLKFV